MPALVHAISIAATSFPAEACSTVGFVYFSCARGQVLGNISLPHSESKCLLYVGGVIDVLKLPYYQNSGKQLLDNRQLDFLFCPGMVTPQGVRGVALQIFFAYLYICIRA